MADLAVVKLPRNGVSLDDALAGSFVPVSAADKWANSGREILVFQNDDAAPVSITVTSQPDELGRVQDEVINVAAGEQSYAGPFLPRGWNETSGADAGKCGFIPSSTTSLSVLVLQISAG
jgi:hypothetical protein